MDPELEARIFAITRPNPKLIVLYLARSLPALFMAPFVFIGLYMKYISLRYQFEKEGVGASWGIFFRRQIYLTYARIQDIHVNRSLVERWLGLGTVEIQTASGSAAAELSVVGLEDYEAVREFLYTRMRGAKGERIKGEPSEPESPSEALRLLHEIRDELRAMRVGDAQIDATDSADDANEWAVDETSPNPSAPEKTPPREDHHV